MSSPDGFAVSLPDVRGYATQITHLSEVYAVLRQHFVHIANDVADGTAFGTGWLEGSQLSGILSAFVDDLHNLVGAEELAAERLEVGLAKTARQLTIAADQYAHQEQRAQDRLNSGDLSADDEAAAESIVEGVTDGEPNSDWRYRIDISALSGLDPNSAAYAATPMTYQDYMTEQEGVWGQVVSGSISGTLSAIVVELTGFDPLKEAIKPFTGNWGFLWYLRDYLSTVARIIEEMGQVLDRGAHTLLAGDWTGAAAESFVHHAQLCRKALGEHAATLTAAATMVGSMGDDMDEAGNKIAPMLQALADIAIAVLESLIARNPIPALVAIGKAALEQLLQGCQPIIDALEATEDVIEIANSSTADLVDQVNDIRTP